MERDTQVRDAVRNEGGVKPTHHARGSRETNELRPKITGKLPVRRAKKGLKRLKGKTGSKTVNQKEVKSKSSAVVASFAGATRPSESRQGGGGRGRKRIPDTPDAIGRFDHNGNKIEEKRTDFSGY